MLLFSAMTTSSPAARCPSDVPEAFPVPQPRTDCGCALLVILFFGWFVVLALGNLVNGEGLIASILYLLLIGGCLWQAWQEHGVCGLLIHFLGVFSWSHFVWRTDSVAGVQDLHFGYKLLGHRLHYLEISAGHVESVYWSPGQGTALAGRDMNDWSVIMWYDDIHGCRKVNRSFKPGLEIYILGPTRHREATEAFGLAFIEFLRAAGATLIETREKDRLVYARPGLGQSLQVPSVGDRPAD